MTHRIIQRGNTAAVLAERDEVLLEKELCFETDSGRYKIGDGVTSWLNLEYFKLLPDLVGAITLPAEPNPPVPEEGSLKVYAYEIAGRVLPKWMGPSGVDTAMQPAIFGNGIAWVTPGSSSVLTFSGVTAPTAVGSISHPIILPGLSARASIRRAIVTSTTTANAASELRIPYSLAYRGEAFGSFISGGFFLVTRWAVSSTVVNQRAFVGFTSSTGATSTSQSPSSLVNCIICGWDSGDTNLQIMYNDASGACTKIDLGPLFPANEPDAIYETIFFAKPNGDDVHYRVMRLDTGDVVSGIMDDNLPSKAIMLTWHAYANNGGTVGSAVLELMRMYLETDY